ncbi:MAG: tRNA lysidine(34) synthetase TilS, partial [Clostridia bacterium]|nr:tRNA lysidine(34) synthetase TilS [Clostridia bacterium]
FSAVNKHGVLYVLSNGEPEIADFKVSLSDCDSKNLITDKKINNLLLKNAIDCDKIVGDLEIRTRKTGDSIRLKNRNCTKTLKKLYTD